MGRHVLLSKLACLSVTGEMRGQQDSKLNASFPLLYNFDMLSQLSCIYALAVMCTA